MLNHNELNRTCMLSWLSLCTLPELICQTFAGEPREACGRGSAMTMLEATMRPGSFDVLRVASTEESILALPETF